MQTKGDSKNKKNDSFSRFPRGKSLEKDLGQLINDDKFHDIAIKCSDGKTVFGCVAILATRSDVFNKLIITESDTNKNLSFNNIDSTAIKVILEFLYTSKAESLTVDNVTEVYYASTYFELVDFQDDIIKFTKKSLNDRNVDVGKKILSACVEKFSLKDNKDNGMTRILVDWIAKNKLEENATDSLSLDGLRYFLEKTSDTQIPFATPEFIIWEYALRKAIRNVIQNETIVKKILEEKSFSTCDPRETEEVKGHLAPIIHHINLHRIDAEEIDQNVEPFNIFPLEELKNAYRFKALGHGLEFIRGVPLLKWKNEGLDSQLDIYNDGFTVKAIKAQQHKSILGDLIFKGKGVYEWDILVERLRGKVYIGICDVDEDLNNTDQKYHGWVLGSDGYVYHKKVYKQYDAKFKEGDKVTVHLDLKMKTCAFSINKNKKPIIPEWKNIPSRVYPVVSLDNVSKLRIEPHVKN